MMSINGEGIEYHGLEFGIEYDDWIAEAVDELDARKTASITGGKPVVKHVFETGWALLPEEAVR